MHDIDRAFGVGLLVIAGWRNQPMFEADEAGGEFDHARARAEVSERALRSGDRHTSERVADRPGLDSVLDCCRQTVGVDV